MRRLERRRAHGMVWPGVVLAAGLALTACYPTSGFLAGRSTIFPRSKPSSDTTAPNRSELSLLPGPPGSVPSRFQQQYAVAESEVEAFSRVAGMSSRNSATTFGTELLYANGNIGPGLLKSDEISNVTKELDAFQALGDRGVTVDVSFPLLLPSTTDSSAYLSYYEQVAQLVRSHNMVLSVEEDPVFSGTPLTTLKIDYRGLTLTSYAAEQREQAQMIIDDLHPRYLSLLTEPDTFTDTLGIDLDTPSAAAEVVSDELDGLDRDGTLIGAGSGTWSSPAIDQALLAQTSIDYLDFHVYPLASSDISNLESDVSMAKAAQKTTVMDETWLNPPNPEAGSGPAGAPAALQLKSYSFWEPLDEQFVTSMIDYVRAQGFAYVSFFDGARAFFAYLTWSPQLEADSYQKFSQLYNQAVVANMDSLDVTRTGLDAYDAITGG